MDKPKIYADFQKLDDFNRLKLTCAGTVRDLKRYGIELRDGLVFTFYMDDAKGCGQPGELRAEGVVHYNDREKCWVAEINWDAVRHTSDEKAAR
jgi:hypothetical protein